MADAVQVSATTNDDTRSKLCGSLSVQLVNFSAYGLTSLAQRRYCFANVPKRQLLSGNYGAPGQLPGKVNKRLPVELF